MKNYNYHPAFITKFILTMAFILCWQAANASAQTTLPCTPPPAGLIAWYPGDGNALDIQGANHGTPSGATFTTTANGKVQEAFSFNGANGTISVPDNASLKPSNVSVDAWVKLNASGTKVNVLAKSRSGNVPSYGLEILADGRVNFFVFTANGSFSDRQSITALTTNVWYHLTGTWDGTTARIYVNGSEESGTTSTGGSGSIDYTGASELSIGSRSAGHPLNGINGNVDEVEIFNRALQPHEIRAIYNSGAQGKCKPCATLPANLVAWYQGDNNAADAVGGNNGTLNGAAFTSAADGKVREAFTFDGTDDFVQVSNNAALNSATITVGGWFYLNRVPPVTDFLVTKYDNNSGNGWILRVINDSTAMFSVCRSGAGCSHAVSNVAVPINTWVHLTGTYDGTTVRVFVNGADSGSAVLNGGYAASSYPMIIGGPSWYSGEYLNGRADEVEIFSRPLNPAEIFNIYKAGSAGKCPSCVNAPNGQVAFYTADGTAEDSQGANEGAMQNGAFYAAGKVDKAFSFDGVDDRIQISGSTGIVKGNSEAAVEAWVRPRGVHNSASDYGTVYFEDTGAVNVTRFGVFVYDDGRLRVLGRDTQTGTSKFVETVAGVVPSNQWTHIVGTWKASVGVKIYVNGAEVAVLNDATLGSLASDASDFVGIGSTTADNFYNGDIDELSIYNTALSAADISNIYSAGRGGKCKPALTTNEISVAVTNSYPSQNSTFTFTATVTNHGSTAATGVVLSAILPANLNFVSADAGCSYDSASRRVTCFIGTIAANFAPRIEAIGELPDVDAPAASVSRGITVHPTATGTTQTIFTTTANEADPAIADNLFAANVVVFPPTAAQAMIGGRVLTADGRGIRGALVTLTDASGSTRTVSSGSFGHYRFTDVEAGQTVIVRVSAKRFRFIPNVRIINVIEDVDDVDFTAQP